MTKNLKGRKQRIGIAPGKSLDTFKQAGNYIDSNGNIYFRKSLVSSLGDETESKSYETLANLDCVPYQCNFLEQYFPNFPLNNFLWPSTETYPNLTPNDVFPIGAGAKEIQGPSQEVNTGAWNGPGTSADYDVLSETIFPYDPCITPGWIFESRDGNVFNHPYAIAGGGFEVYGAFLIRGDGVSNTPGGTLASSSNDYIAEATNSASTRSSTVNFGFTLNNNLLDIGVDLLAQVTWNGDTGQNSNSPSADTLQTPQITISNDFDFKRYVLCVVNYKIKDVCTVYPYLLNGLFNRWQLIGEYEYLNMTIYGFDDSGDTVTATYNDDGRKFVLVKNLTEQYDPGITLDPGNSNNLALIYGDMRTAGIVFKNEPIDGAEMWNRMAQNRSGYVPPPECG